MAINKVWIHGQIIPLFQRLQEKLDGFAPFMNVYADEQPQGPAALHKPTLYPELNIPAERGGDWGEVARGIAHLLSSLDGVPELRVTSGTETDISIAKELNAELQIIAAAKEGLQPKPQWTYSAPGKLLEKILNPAPNTLDAARLFGLLQLHRLVLDGHPEAQATLEEARQKLPAETKAAESTLDAILSEDLRTPDGKAVAAEKLLQVLGFDPGCFYLQRSQHIAGVYDDRSLDYYPALRAIREEFESLRPLPGSWLRFQLPFALPVLEGIYRSEGVIAFVQHVRVINPRAGWKATQGMRLDSMMSPSGLYAQSVVELWLPGELKIDTAYPPGNVQYKNIETYPEALRVAVLRLNKFIMGLRAETGRSDIPEVLPGDLNQLAFKQFDSVGRLARNIPMANFEFLRVSAGAPMLKDEVRFKPHDVEHIGFGRELLESAKFHVSAYNTRRAVLDLAGAFEAFVADAITPRLVEMEVNTRDQFLRQYGAKLSAETCAEIKRVALEKSQDPPRMPPIHRQLKEYKRKGLRPAFDKWHLSRIQKIMSIRNDAAHGRPVSPEVLNDLIAAIEALECLIHG
ncbi:hypothetical protein [Marinobacter sp. LV10MA510-1]|uniref:hypothetical protein n=1 Tax=Marinobacter sp. LV10MA510-1 TaxID=1415567 RepID=UPI000BFA9218|nr:hypothetical protein [Marinobacter sp. LV10MA510-1]